MGEADMKKRGSTTRFLMWVMVIWLQAQLSIAAELSKSKSNGTTSTSVVCDGSVEDCLNVHHLDSQLPTISSSHFRRILAGGGKNNLVPQALKSEAFLCPKELGYRRCKDSVPPAGIPNRCANKEQYDRQCHNVDIPP